LESITIFNTFSESLIKVEKSFYADFIEKLNYSNQDAELNSTKEAFIKSGFIVEDDFDEITYIKIKNRQWRHDPLRYVSLSGLIWTIRTRTIVKN